MVRAPLRVRMGAASPCAVALYTVMESPAAFATYTSPRSASTEMPVGQFIWVFGPSMNRNGAVFPLASAAKTVTDGGAGRPGAPPPPRRGRGGRQPAGPLWGRG